MVGGGTRNLTGVTGVIRTAGGVRTGSTAMAPGLRFWGLEGSGAQLAHKPILTRRRTPIGNVTDALIDAAFLLVGREGLEPPTPQVSLNDEIQ